MATIESSMETSQLTNTSRISLKYRNDKGVGNTLDRLELLY